MSPFKAASIDTPLGPIKAIADEKALYLLHFDDHQVEQFKERASLITTEGWTDPLRSIEQELHQYFNGERTVFQTPIQMIGSPFQKQVWEELKNIPFGVTHSYATIARSINKPSAFRTVAAANGANPIVIIIPCHRVIYANGSLGGYSGGVERKQWLLKHETKMESNPLSKISLQICL